MCKVNVEYLLNVIYENSKKAPYMEVLMAIQGGMELAIRWQKLYSQTRAKECFVINAYIKCVDSKMINRKQCITSWNMTKGHVDDFTITRGGKHNFLWINIEIRDDVSGQ